VINEQEYEEVTIRIPKENFLDKILKLIGKERKVTIPEEADEIYKEKGPYWYERITMFCSYCFFCSAYCEDYSNGMICLTIPGKT
jgi:hypothetical protein